MVGFPPGAHRRPWVILAASVFGVGLASSGVVRQVDWALHDRLVAVATYDASPPENLVVVAIDEPSVEQLRMPWPWPRRVHAALIRALASAGARTIVLDLAFDEPASNAEDDGILRETISQVGNVVLATRPIASLATAASGLGVASLPMDRDGIVRRYSAMVGNQPSLAAAAEASEGPERSASGLIPFHGRPGAGIRTVSYYRALQSGQLPPGFFRGKTVFVGRSAHTARGGQTSDGFRTPVGLMAGVEIHASALAALAGGRFAWDPFDGALPMTLLLTPVTVVMGWLAVRAGARLSILVFVLAATAWSAAAYVLRADDLARLPIVAPLVSTATALVVVSAYRLAVAARERTEKTLKL